MTKNKLRKRSLKSFAILTLALLALSYAWEFVHHDVEDEGISPFFHDAFEWNGKIWQKVFSPERQAPEFSKRPRGSPARVNGDIGLQRPIDISNWALDVIVDADNDQPRHLKIKLDELRTLPRVESTIEFKCIEGWSQVISYAGVRFSDFLKHYKLGSHALHAWEDGKIPPNRFMYVGLQTPDGEYYVSNDMESMLHPQTLLAYEMNGEALTAAHGAPLRLIIPVKYGIKSLKRIGQIYFSDQRPPDYWAERGYDWFSGL